MCNHTANDMYRIVALHYTMPLLIVGRPPVKFCVTRRDCTTEAINLGMGNNAFA
jgi:hypothetical protein